MPHGSQVTVAINYSDEQNLMIKAYHKTRFEIYIVGIRNNLSYTKLLYSLTDNYNHCSVNETEAKESLTKRLLTDMFHYIHQNTV